MELYEQIIELYQTYGSVNAVVEELKGAVSKIKVQRVLLTEGLWTSRTAEAVGELYAQGKSTAEIAEILCMSVKNVQSYIPYSKGSYGEKETVSSRLSRNYRERNRHASENMIHKKESVKEKEETMAIMTEDKVLNYNGVHLELDYPDPEGEEKRILQKYGRVKEHITRDIIVPGDITLHALNYAIQRAFGWQNSHLRQFELPEERFAAITNGNAHMWSRLVGVLFRSPLMDEDEEFWVDDYNGGSFKNWLRKKYTGPYMSQCRGEGIMSSREDMKRLLMNEEYYVMYAKAYNYETKKYDGEEYVGEVMPVYDYNGKKRPEPKPWHGSNVPYRVEIVPFRDVPSGGLRFVFDRNPMALLERLPIGCVLAAGKFSTPDSCGEEERKYIDQQITVSGDDVCRQVENHITRILEDQIDSPDLQPEPDPVTDVLLYNYDFGDDWKIRITASENCPDLVESGRITQAELDRANVKCREVYRPVLIARDGEMLVDDVGGLHGFADFLEKINPELKGMDLEEKEDAKREKKEMLVWAKSLGWHREKSTDFNLL